MIAFLFSRVGAYIIGGLAIVVVLAGLYHKIQTDAVEASIARTTADQLKRVEDANDAANSARNDPARMRKLDEQFCRDC